MRLRNISLLVLALLAFTSPSWAIGIAGSAGGKRVTVSVDGTWQGTYAAGTTYAIGDITTDGTTNYRSLQNANTGHTPASSPLYWQAILTKGDTGPTGSTGPQGETGPAGKTVLTTSGAPASGTGVDGDYAYDPATYTMYGPKAAGAWPAGTVIKGADGAGFTGGSDGTYGWLTDSNTSSYTECASGKYGLNFVGGVLYQCSNGTNSVFTSGGGTWGSITGTLSAQADLQAALDAISAGGITISTAIPTTAGAAYLNDTTHVLTVASTTGYTQFTGSFTAWDTPSVSSATLGTDGTTLTLGMSASTSVGAGGSGGIVATGGTSGALSGTYSSGAPGTSLVYTLPSSIKSGETVTLAYTQPGNGLEGTTGGVDVATVSGTSVTNNSEAVASASCSGTPSVTLSTIANNSLYVGDSNNRHFTGLRYLGTSTIPLCSIRISMKVIAGDVSGKTYVAKMFALDPSTHAILTPSSPSATSTNTISGSALTSTFAYQTFTLPPEVNINQNYAVIVQSTSSDDATNYAAVAYYTNTSSDWYMGSWNATGTIGLNTDMDVAASIYGW